MGVCYDPNGDKYRNNGNNNNNSIQNSRQSQINNNRYKNQNGLRTKIESSFDDNIDSNIHNESINSNLRDNSIRESNNVTSNYDYKNTNLESISREIPRDMIIQNFSSLDEYKNKKLIQDTFFENSEGSDDSVYNELKKLEKEKLKKEFDKNSDNHIKNLIGKLKLSVNNDLIQKIIENQDAKYIFKNKIIENINNIKNSQDEQGKKYDINYLTILLVGRKDVGKTTLVKYILNLKDEDIKRIQKNNGTNKDFVTYKSKYITYLKLIEYKGIGYGKGSDPKAIGHNTVKYIKNHIDQISRNNKDSYNDYVHCIWYCVSDSRFEDEEKVVLRQLKNSYNDNNLPIVLVYTQAEDIEMADKMGNYIDGIEEETIFVKILAEEVELPDNKGRLPPFGKEELLNITLKKCTEALGGNMINIMIRKISNDIKGIMLDINSEKEKTLNDLNINKFINKYNEVLQDEQFMNYIICMLGINLQKLFYDKKIYNSSLNLLIQSDIIRNIKNFISLYKKKTKDFIKTKINYYPEVFIDLQANKEKERKCDIEIENKRNINGFKRTTEVFFKKNFYYISQKYAIDFIIRNFCFNYFLEFRKRLDNIVKELLNYENNTDIKNELILCFKMKLKHFAEKNNIDVNINLDNYEKIENELPNENEINQEILKIEVQNTNSFDLGYNYNELKGESQNVETIKCNNLENWFPLFHNDFKYLDNKLIESFSHYLQTKDSKDNYFKLDDSDKVVNSLREYMKKDLDNFFNCQKSKFIEEIHKEYTKKKIDHKFPIQSILNKEQIANIYLSNIKAEFQRLKQDDTFAKIDYITTIVVGRSGVGKSTLINCLLELEGDKKAPEDVGNIVSLKDAIYENSNIPFLRIIDTRGIELNKDYGPAKILEETLNIIKKQINNQGIEDENKYNNYVQCIWYCVNGSSLEQKEIDVIKGLLKKKGNLPLIIVYTNAKNNKKIQEMENFIKKAGKELKDILFIPVLARTIRTNKFILESFGKEKLISSTINKCKESLKTDVFEEIKRISTNTIIETFEEINKKIKFIGNKNMVLQIIDTFNDKLKDRDFLHYIFSLLEKIITEYSKTDKNEKKLSSESMADFNNSSSFISFFENYIKFYKEKTKNIIDNIKNKKSLKYLDIQVNKEIKEFKKNILNENKSNKNNFIQIIQIYLESKFYYLSQKYLLYRLITDLSEPFSEEVEKEVNKIVRENLANNEALVCCQELYSYKLEDIDKKFREFIKKGGYKKLENGGNNLTNNNNNMNTKNDMPMENEDNLDCPNVNCTKI